MFILTDNMIFNFIHFVLVEELDNLGPVTDTKYVVFVEKKQFGDGRVIKIVDTLNGPLPDYTQPRQNYRDNFVLSLDISKMDIQKVRRLYDKDFSWKKFREMVLKDLLKNKQLKNILGVSYE